MGVSLRHGLNFFGGGGRIFLSGGGIFKMEGGFSMFTWLDSPRPSIEIARKDQGEDTAGPGGLGLGCDGRLPRGHREHFGPTDSPHEPASHGVAPSPGGGVRVEAMEGSGIQIPSSPHPVWHAPATALTVATFCSPPRFTDCARPARNPSRGARALDPHRHAGTRTPGFRCGVHTVSNQATRLKPYTPNETRFTTTALPSTSEGP